MTILRINIQDISKIRYSVVKKFFILNILLFLSLISFAQIPKHLIIKGKLRNFYPYKKVSLIKFDYGFPLLDTSNISKDGFFEFKTYVADTNFYKIQFDEKNFFIVIGTPGEEMFIETDLRDISRLTKVKGSVFTQFIYDNIRISRDFEFKMDSLNKVYYTYLNHPNADSVRKKLQSEYQLYESGLKKHIIKILKENPNNLGCLFFTEKLKFSDAPEVFVYVDSTLKKMYPKNMLVQEFNNKVRKFLQLRIGGLAPEIELPDTNGQIIKLSSFRGKYVLIDFWASWCSPCLKEIPHLKKAYELYNKKGFEIYGVSLDKQKQSWINTIRKNNMNWIHVSDLKYWQSPVVSQYAFDGIPHTILIDPDGRIIEKDLRGEKLLQKLDEIFAN